MNMKNIIYITGIITILTTFSLILFNKLDVTSFSVINTTVLSVLYGWYQKIEKEDVKSSMKLMTEDHIHELQTYKTRLVNLKSELSLVKSEKTSTSNIDIELKEKPKRKPRKKKDTE